MIDDNVRPQFEAWLRQQLDVCSQSGEEYSFSLIPIQGDAGFRRYFRLDVGPSNLIAVYAPPATENSKAFVSIGEFLFDQGVHVPKIVSYDLARGFLLVEDLGRTVYLDHLDDDSANTLYGEALFSLLRIQQCPLNRVIFPEYDQQRLLDEMALFKEWFVSQLLQHQLNDSEDSLITHTFDLLVENALDQPQVVVHRDFHSRNIVYGAEGVPGIIDFQDAVIGPVTYDLVSLLRDCYIAWPQDRVERWAIAYANMAVDVGILHPVSEEKFLKWFDLMGLQRHIKVLGIFSRLSLRDGKDEYLDDLPLVVHYVRNVSKKHPETESFAAWFDKTLVPLIELMPFNGP